MNGRDRLCLNPLRGVDNHQRPLTGGQGSRNLIGKVHMARGIEEV